MIKLVEWDNPSKIGERTYKRGCIKLPDSKQTVNIILYNFEAIEKYKIGSALLLENEIGIFAYDIKYFVDIEYLDKILQEYYEKSKHLIKNYTSDLAIALNGVALNSDIYSTPNSLDFSFIGKLICTDESISDIIRDIKINEIIKTT